MDIITEPILVILGLFAMAIIGAILFLVKVAGDLAAQDARGWLAKATKGLIRQAADRLPGPEGQRYGEEWEAELKELLDRPFTAFGWAVMIWWSAGRLARDLEVEVEPAPSAGGLPGARAAVAMVAAVMRARTVVNARVGSRLRDLAWPPARKAILENWAWAAGALLIPALVVIVKFVTVEVSNAAALGISLLAWLLALATWLRR